MLAPHPISRLKDDDCQSVLTMVRLDISNVHNFITAYHRVQFCLAVVFYRITWL